jgi:hypothetical protein
MCLRFGQRVFARYITLQQRVNKNCICYDGNKGGERKQIRV